MEGRDVVQAIKENLKEQGLAVAKVSLYGYIENLDDPKKGFLSSTSSPRRGGATPAKSPSPTAPLADPHTQVSPENAVATYKQRMAHSNVSFA
jgi:hypothetical protein